MPLELEIEIYTSRLIGTADELQRYFERAHRYRREGSLVNPSAFIFIDDPWHETDTSNDLYLDRLYREVDVIQDRTESTLDNYVDKLTGDGAEFVFQKVHAGPRIMNFKDEPSDHQLYPRDVSRLNLKVSFLNLTNCSAAKFSEYERSLGEAYTVGTDYGLAIIGSTKVGHLARPDDFHKNLGDGMYWGEAYKAWYNSEGSDSDKWHLGVVLMGDPLLRVVGDVLPAAEQ
jgi:hypothetical protein